MVGTRSGSWGGNLVHCRCRDLPIDRNEGTRTRRKQAVKETIRDRALLVGVASLVVLCTLIVGYVSDVIGLGSVGLLVAIETVFVFGAALSYCRMAWPRWHMNARERTAILAAYFLLLTGHFVIAALVFRRLRLEWGMWVWMAMSVAELVGAVLVFEFVMRYARGQAS